jgi:hypothetical protein
MMNKNAGSPPPWPVKKKILVTIGGSVGILLVSGLIGSGVYGVLVGLGQASKPFSLKNAVVNQALEDPGIVNLLTKQLGLTTCINPDLGYGLEYEGKLNQTDDTCSRFELNSPGGEKSEVTLTRLEGRVEELADTEIERFFQVTSGDLAHERFRVLRIIGQNDQGVEAVYLIGFDLEESLRVHISDSDPVLETIVEKMIQSLRRI